MADGFDAGKTDSKASVQALLATYRHVGVPLMQALAEAPQGAEGEAPSARGGLNPADFLSLVDSTVMLSRELASSLGDENALDPGTRWQLAGAASQVVASSFRATGKPMSEAEGLKFAGLVLGLQDRFKAHFSDSADAVPNDVATFRARMMETMVPVIGAVAQYAFGRAEHNLLAEVAERLVKSADQMTRALAPAGATPEQWRVLCWNILRAAGQIYTECHYAEADRLLFMSPEERTAYFVKNNNVVPMTQVWQAFNQRMAMMATLATYLEVPDAAKMDQQVW